MNRRDALGALIGLTALSPFQQAHAQSELDRVLPPEFTNRLRLNFQQAGRDVEVWVANPNSQWVITQIIVELEYKPVVAEKVRNAAQNAITDFYPAPEIRRWSLSLLPDKVAKFGMKMGDESVVAGMRLQEVRGRERTLIEQIQRYLF